MDVNILFQRFAEQSPLIILCGLIIWQLLKMYKEEKALVRTERKEHEQKIQELNTYVREREIEHIETLNRSMKRWKKYQQSYERYKRDSERA
jgi:hypothetical protein